MLDLHTDGCIKGNIPARPFRIFFAAKCPHTKVLAAEIVIRAESEQDARSFAETWLLTGPLRGQTIVDRVIEEG
jgi:hypothetical protein